MSINLGHSLFPDEIFIQKSFQKNTSHLFTTSVVIMITLQKLIRLCAGFFLSFSFLAARILPSARAKLARPRLDTFSVQTEQAK